jgi:hypothetical protein
MGLYIIRKLKSRKKKINFFNLTIDLWENILYNKNQLPEVRSFIITASP